MDVTQHLVVTGAAILVIAALGQVVAQRTPVPSILFYLACGILFGPAALNLILTEEMGDTLPAIVRLAVAIIVFEGAFSLEGHHLRTVRRPVRNLVTLGVAVTGLLGTLAAHYIAGLPWSLSILYAALVSVTGPTVISPLLQRVRVRGRVRATLAGEGVIADPVGAVFAIVVFELVRDHNRDIAAGALSALGRLALGAIWGVAGGVVLLLILRQLGELPSQVARIMTIAGAAAIFTTIESLVPESGLAAAVAAGMLLGSVEFPHREEVESFKGDITLIIIATVYLLLAATLHPTDLAALGWRGPATVLVMMLVVRPVGVFLSTRHSALSHNDRLFVAAIGPRGVVAASLATLIALSLSQAGNPHAAGLLGLVFLTIVITIAVQASYAGWLAAKLGVLPVDIVIIGGGKVGTMLARELSGTGEDVTVVERDAATAEGMRQLGVNVVVGDGTDPDVLAKAGVARAKAIVATTGSDKDNLLACQVAKTTFGQQRLVARVTDPETIPSFEAAGIQVMNPARATAMILTNLVRRPNLFHLLSQVAATEPAGPDVTEVAVGDHGAVGRTLRELRLPAGVLVLLIRRGTQLMIPRGDTRFEPGDIVSLVGTPRAAGEAANILQGT